MNRKPDTNQPPLFVVDPGSGVPVYRQLMDQVKFQIACGKLSPGDPLPSTRTLSLELGVNPMTISKAYSFLEREGLLLRRPGRSTVVKAPGEEDERMDKVALLRQSLKPPVEVVRQLNMDPEQALNLFRELLSEHSKDGAEGER